MGQPDRTAQGRGSEAPDQHATRPSNAVPRPSGLMVGRDDVMATLDGVLDDVRRGVGRVLALRGEPGMGKTTLLSRMVAGADGTLVLQARGHESEAQLAYAGLFDLCRPLLDHLDRLPAYQAESLRGALALAKPADQDRFAAAVGFLGLVTLAVEQTPVLVVVDDAQWIDVPTAEAVSFVARRLRSDPVAFVVASRDEHSHGPLFEGFELVALTGLEPDAAIRLLSLNASTPVAAGVATVLADLSGGNPLTLAQLPTLLDADQLAGRTPLPNLSPAGSEPAGAFGERFAGLPPETVRAAGVAALWTGRTADLVDDPAIGFDIDALGPAVEAGLVVVAEDGIAFRHPLARSAAVQALTPGQRRTIHRALAELVADDVELHAFHLAESTDSPDPAASHALAAAAGSAASRGALATAVGLLEQASSLAPDRHDRGRLLVEAASMAAACGDTQQAVELCQRADGLVTDTVVRARLGHQRGRMALLGSMAVPRAMDLLDVEMARASSIDPDLAVRIGVDACMLAMVTGNCQATLDVAARTRDIARSRGADIGALGELTWHAARAFADDPVDDATVIGGHERLLAGDLALGDVKTATELAMTGLSAQERYGTACLIGEHFIAAARSRGAVGVIPLTLALAAKCFLMLDDWVSASALAEEAIRLAQETGQVFGAHYATSWSTVLAALQGRDADVESLASVSVRRNTSLATTPGDAIVSHAFALLALGHGHVGEAVVHLSEVARLRATQGATGNGLIHWEGDFAEALIRAGRADEAEAFVGELEERATRSSSSWPAVVAARLRGMLAEEPEIDTAFGRAVAAFVGNELPFERLRTEWCWGERLVATGRVDAGGAHLRRALAGFDGFDAASWAAHTRQVLVRAGLRPESARPDAGSDLDLATTGVSTWATHGRPVAGGRSVADTARALLAPPDGGAAPARGAGGETTTVVTLGDFVVRTPGREGRPAGHVGRSIAFVVARGASVHTDELIDALWPEVASEVGRGRLRNVLSRGRRSTGSVLVRDGECIRLADDVRVDAAAFEACASEAFRLAGNDDRDDRDAVDAAHKALALYGGEFVPSNRYDDWTAATRERLERTRLGLVELLIAACERRGDIDEMLAYLEQAIQADPYDEARYVRAARSLMASGRTGPAMRMVERAEAVVAELGLVPDGELAVLRDLLGTGG